MLACTRVQLLLSKENIWKSSSDAANCTDTVKEKKKKKYVTTHLLRKMILYPDAEQLVCSAAFSSPALSPSAFLHLPASRMAIQGDIKTSIVSYTYPLG